MDLKLCIVGLGPFRIHQQMLVIPEQFILDSLSSVSGSRAVRFRITNMTSESGTAFSGITSIC